MTPPDPQGLLLATRRGRSVDRRVTMKPSPMTPYAIRSYGHDFPAGSLWLLIEQGLAEWDGRSYQLTKKGLAANALYALVTSEDA